MSEGLVNPAVMVSSAQKLFTIDEFDALVTEHQRVVYRVLMSMLRDPEAAATLTQDCFVRAFEKRQSFRGEAKVSTWLLRIAMNLARDHIRDRKQTFWRKIFASSGAEEHETAAATLPSTQPNAERELLAREQAQEVWRIASKLSLKQREVFTLRFAEDMELEEIAEVLAMRLGTVKTHLSRALAIVRQELKGDLR